MKGMSLSRRLRDAALERARDHGELMDSFVLDADGVIDLRSFDDDREVEPPSPPDATLADPSARREGATRRCPLCQAPGRRDLIDRVNDIEFYSCDGCFHMWQIRREI